MINKYDKIGIAFGINKLNYNKITEVAENKKKSPNIILLILMGILIGFINGFWGGGGGMICVAVLRFIIKLPEKVSHATTILIILPLCISSFIIYWINNTVTFNLYVIGGFLVGGIIGAILLKKINNTFLSVFFALLIIVAGLKLVFF